MKTNPTPLSSNSTATTASTNIVSASATSAAELMRVPEAVDSFGTTRRHTTRLRWTNEAANIGHHSDSATEPSATFATTTFATTTVESSTRWTEKDSVVHRATPVDEKPIGEESVEETRSAVSNANGRFKRFISRLLAPSSIWNVDWNDEHQREDAYALETRELFRRRLRLVSVVAVIGLLPYAAFYIYLAPQLVASLLSLFGLMMIVATGTFAFARHLPDFRSLRILCLVSYGSFSIAAAMVVAAMGQQHSFVLGDHNHIVLTTLLLPLMVGECLTIGVFAFLSLAVASRLVPDQSSLFYAHLFTLANTTIFVLFIGYLQNVLRRHAFDSAFDIVLAAKRLQNLSVKDTLTGGYNRRQLENVLDVEVARAVRFERPLSVIMFDLDNFKVVNDSNGHAAGDRVLVEVWNATSTAIRDVDTAARYGGDEFAIILPETGEVAALTVAERLKKAVSARLLEHFASDSLEAQVTLSAGIVTVRPQQLVPNHKVLEMADERLYTAKRNGKNNIAY